MRTRTTAILAITSVLALTLMSPAAAQTGSEPPTRFASYEAAGTATALTLTLLGEDLAVSNTSAAVGSGEQAPEAASNGAALLLAGTPVPGDAPSAAPGGQANNESCAVDIDLGAETQGALSALGLGVACVRTSATTAGGIPGAHSESGELIITVTSPAGTALEPILTPLFDGAEQITTPVLEALAPLLDGVEEVTQVELDTILNDLITNLQDELFVLAQIVVAPTASQASATDEGAFARAGGNGVTINLFPGIAATLADLGLDIAPSVAPLLSVKLGQGVASVLHDGTSGSTEGSAAQLLSIEAADELGILQELTGQLTTAIDDLAVEQLGCNEGNPLADVICIDLGSVRELTGADLAARGLDLGDDAVGVEATAASIQLLPVAAESLGGSVLGLSLASATAGAIAELQPAPIVEETEEAPRSLPRTGNDTALPATMALLAAASAGLVLVRRTRTV